VKYTAAEYHEAVGFICFLHAQCEVLFQFFFQTLFNVTAGHKLSFFTKEWRIVDGEEHAHRWLVNGNRWQRFRIFEVGEGVADFKLFNTVDCADITRYNTFNLAFSETFENVQFFDTTFHHAAIALGQGDGHARSEFTAMQFANGHAAGVG